VFTEFETEPGVDFLRVYDLGTTTLLGTFSGSTLPPQTVAMSGSMYIEFKTNGSLTYPGWKANYYCFGVGIGEENFPGKVLVYPNPAQDQLHINVQTDDPMQYQIDLISVDGRIIDAESISNMTTTLNKDLNISSLARGIYFLRLKSDKNLIVKKVSVQ